MAAPPFVSHVRPADMKGTFTMNNIIYLVGLVVIIVAIVGFVL